MKRKELEKFIVEALESLGGKASIIEVSKYIWENYEHELRLRSDLFYTWQYEIRWAAKGLRDAGRIKPASESSKGAWELV
ncbi:hypothetical protein [Paenibacillus silvae]|uniref:Restriction system protein Mrr-like N-terminal domain-containing protein n=1 Tax=Paenibacillus silvae TaxID=1325358 RepID=A0A2W6NKL3_9BACL|nr:hypothetical protein [Paenibacillus silvae]PZT55628.1 hypothetical protein DN757_11125 [Paenibacillus silvae]